MRAASVDLGPAMDNSTGSCEVYSPVLRRKTCSSNKCKELESIRPASAMDSRTPETCKILGPVLKLRKACSDKCKDVFTVKTAVLCVVIAAVWVGLLVPTVAYTLKRQESSTDECEDCNSSHSGGSRETSDFEDNSSPMCSEGFYVSLEDITSGTTVEVCRPECGEWEEFPHSTVVAIYAMEIVAAVVYILGVAVLLVLSVMQNKQMFRFPSVFIIYIILGPGLTIFMGLLGNFDLKSMFCSSKDLMKSLENPTIYCTLSGAVLCYVLVATPLLLAVHISSVFCGVKFPFYYHKIKQHGYFKYIHIGAVLMALLLPCISVGMAFGTGGFTLVDFSPTSICIARDPDVTFYAVLLPFSILKAVGFSMTVVIFQELVLRRSGNPPSHLKGKEHLNFSMRQFNTPEFKVLIIFIYYFVITAIFLVAFTILGVVGPEFEEDLGEYLACEATGAIPGKDCSKPQDRLNGIIIYTLNRCLLALFPLVNLIYVVNGKELKQMFRRRKTLQSKRSTIRISKVASV